MKSTAIVLTLCGLTALASAPAQAVQVQLELIAQGIVGATDVVEAPDGSGRLFIADQVGRVYIYSGGALLATPFLDVSAKLVPLEFYDERGLLGFAFHPDYATNGRFFVRYSRPGGTGTHQEVLAEYHVSAGNPNLADPASEHILLVIDEPEVNHNGGSVVFGPDGLMYLSFGDGGGEGDDLADPNLLHGPIGNGQNIDVLLGKILRIDVDSPPDVGFEYHVPAGNPFVGVTGRDEVYAYGFRNPYRISFDDGPGGDGALFVADVGQNLFEELDIVGLGGDYGWVVREGFHCFDAFNPDTPPPTCPNTGPNGEPLIDPRLEYSHADVGIAITGGFVYRGRGVPELANRYVFADFSATFFPGAGHMFYTDITGPNAFVRNPIDVLGGLTTYLRGFGEDLHGELYLLTSSNIGPTGTTGRVYRIVVDTDGDGIFDVHDNCTRVANANQRDTNGDGYGNACDADLDNSGTVNFADLGQLKSVFFTTVGNPNYNPDADFDGDGAINFIDLGTMEAGFFAAPGPSGLAP